MKAKLIILTLAVCTIAAPAQADLFTFGFNNLNADYSGTTFTATKTTGSTSGTIGSVTRWVPIAGQAKFDWSVAANYLADQTAGISGNTSLQGDFQISMALSNITPTGADATGSFTIWDVSDNGSPPAAPADTIYGDIGGNWWKDATGALKFAGLLSNVGYTDPVAGNFDGHVGAIDFAVGGSPPPWAGSIIQLTVTSAPWFTAGDFNVDGGGVQATIVPVPGAILLGILGLGAAGIKLRKYA